MSTSEGQALSFYERSYGSSGLDAQRRYPNEEFCRFMGRHFFKVDPSHRRNVRILEAGCGSGSNLWMIAREGFDSYGFDFSPTSIELCKQMMTNYGVTAEVKCGDMTNMSYPADHFDAVVDVFSSCCLDDAGHASFLDGVTRILKPGGRFFSYTPSKGSTDWVGPGNVRAAPGSPLVYPNNLYPFRYTSVQELTADLRGRGLTVTGAETLRRSYRKGTVIFEFAVVEAQRH